MLNRRFQFLQTNSVKALCFMTCSVALLACETVNSSTIATKKLFPSSFAKIENNQGTDVKIWFHVDDRNSLTFAKLDDKDDLRIKVNGKNTKWTRSTSAGETRYAVDYPFSDEPVDVEWTLTRNKGTPLVATMKAPGAVRLTSPRDDVGFDKANDGKIEFLWKGDHAKTVELNVDSDCGAWLHVSPFTDNGNLSVTPESLINAKKVRDLEKSRKEEAENAKPKRKPNPIDLKHCALKVALKRENPGTVDRAFGGGSATGIRTQSFTIVMDMSQYVHLSGD